MTQMRAHPGLAWLLCFCTACGSSQGPEPDNPLDGRGGGIIAYCYQSLDLQPQRIWIMNADGSASRQVSHATIGLNHHEWSPDARRLVVTGYDRVDAWSLYAMDADGGSFTRLTDQDDVEDTEPAWPPDRAGIAFTSSGRDARTGEIWVMKADGTGRRRLSADGVNAFGPRWSPDGSLIAFSSELPGPVLRTEVFVLNADGRGLRRLTTSAGNHISYNPA